MDDLRFRVVTGTDPDFFEERVNRAVSELPKEAVLVDVKFSAAGEGSRVLLAALIVYKLVKPWED